MKVIILSVLGMIGLGSNASAQRQFEFGVGVHMGGAAYGFSVTEINLEQLGASFRNDVLWSNIETTKGNLQFPGSLKTLDDLVTVIAANHKRPILILDYGNKFYDGGGQITSDAGIAAFTSYAQFVVNHFKGRVDQFEVWNEWNRGSGSTSATQVGSTSATQVKGDPVLYANLLRATYQAVKQINPAATVLGGVIGVGSVETAWVEKFASVGGLKFLDGFSVHPYVHCWASKTPSADLSNAATFGNVHGTPEFSIALIDQLHATLQKYSPNQVVPIYVTEIGWPTTTAKCGSTDTVAAAYLQRFYLSAISRPWISGVWWYDLADDGNDPTQSEQTFGLTHNGVPKPAYQSFLLINDLLAGSGVVAVTSPAGVVVVSGKNTAGKPFYAAWLQTDNFQIQQPWAQGQSLLKKGYLLRGQEAPPANLMISAAPTILVGQ